MIVVGTGSVGFIFGHNTRCEIRAALSMAQQQKCRATQDRCLLGIFVFLQPTEHLHGLQDLCSACMISVLSLIRKTVCRQPYRELSVS